MNTPAQRLGDRRASWAEAEKMLHDGLKPVIEMAMASAMTGTPLNREFLRVQLTGLLRVITLSADQPQQRTLPHEPHAMPAQVADGVKHEQSNP